MRPARPLLIRLAGPPMTLAQLSITVALLGALGLLASRFGLSAIPAYLLAGLLLGPNEPKVLSLIQPLRGDRLRR